MVPMWFSFIEGAPFHETTKNIDKQASGPGTNTLGREITYLDLDLVAPASCDA